MEVAPQGCLSAVSKNGRTVGDDICINLVQNILASNYFDFPNISMLAVIISILVVLVIIIVVAAAVWTSGSSQDSKDAQTAQEPAKKALWRRFYDINFVYNDPPGPRMSRPDGRVTFAGDTDNVSQCQDWCEKDPDCLGYTHVGNTGTAWANQCYLVKSYAHGVAANNKNHQSGWKYYA